MQAVLKDGPGQVITGPVYFTNLTVEDGNVIVITTVNGFDISEDFLDLASEQYVFSKCVFQIFLGQVES